MDQVVNRLKGSMRTSTPIKSLLTEALNLIAEAEFEAYIGVKPYERSGERKGYRLGHRERRFDTTCETIKINVSLAPRRQRIIPEHRLL